MRALTQYEANSCEQAKDDVCKCRCGGVKHGAKRIPDDGDFSELPLDDPHYRPAVDGPEVLRNAIKYLEAQVDRWWTASWREAIDILWEALGVVKTEDVNETQAVYTVNCWCGHKHSGACTVDIGSGLKCGCREAVEKI